MRITDSGSKPPLKPVLSPRVSPRGSPPSVHTLDHVCLQLGLSLSHGPRVPLGTHHAASGWSLPARCTPAAPAWWPWSGQGTWEVRPGLHRCWEHCGQPANCLHWLSLPAGLPWGTGTPTSASNRLKQGMLRRTHLAGLVSAGERKKGLPPSSKHFWKKGKSQCTGPSDGGRSGRTLDRSAQAGLGN